MTQVKVGGLGGVIGFDYAALPFIFETYEVPKELWPNYLDKIAVLSEIQLRYWNEKVMPSDS